jgi:hypothetical protein
MLDETSDKLCKTCSVKMTTFGFIKPKEAEEKKNKTEDTAAAAAAAVVVRTIDALKAAELPGEKFDWICTVCQFLYDNGDYVPFRVSEVYAKKKKNRYAPEEDHLGDTLPGCGHCICEKCANNALARGLACPMCRANVKSYEPDVKLLSEIVAYKEGCYVALARQTNEASWRNVPLEREMQQLKEKHAPLQKTIGELRSEIAELKLNARNNDALTREAAAARYECEKLNKAANAAQAALVEAQKDARVFKSQIKSVSSINELLFADLIDTRLRQVGSGMLEPHQLGLTVVPRVVQLDPDKTTIHIAMGPPSKRTATVVYGCNIRRMGLAGANMIDQIEQYAKATKGASLLEVNLPETEQDVREGFIAVDDQCVMVRGGSWMQRYISSTEQTPEGVFDSASVDMQGTYSPASTSVVKQALKTWKDLFDARQKKAQEVASVVEMWFCQDTTCFACLEFTGKQKCAQCNYCHMYYCPMCDALAERHTCPSAKEFDAGSFYGEGCTTEDAYFARSLHVFEYRSARGHPQNTRWTQAFVDAFIYWCATNKVPGTPDPPHYPNVRGLNKYIMHHDVMKRVWTDCFSACRYPCGRENVMREFYYAQCRALLAFARVPGVAATVEEPDSQLWFDREKTCFGCMGSEQHASKLVHCDKCNMFRCEDCDGNFHRCRIFGSEDTVPYGDAIAVLYPSENAPAVYFVHAAKCVEMRVNKGKTNPNDNRWFLDLVRALEDWVVANARRGEEIQMTIFSHGMRTVMDVFDCAWVRRYGKYAYTCGVNNAMREFYYAQCRLLLACSKPDVLQLRDSDRSEIVAELRQPKKELPPKTADREDAMLRSRRKFITAKRTPNRVVARPHVVLDLEEDSARRVKRDAVPVVDVDSESSPPRERQVPEQIFDPF